VGLIAEFEIGCPTLPLTGVVADLGGATATLELQYNHGDRPLFLLTVAGGAPTAVADALAAAHDVGGWTLVGRAGETRRYKIRPALSLEEQLDDSLDDLSDLEALATAEAIVERIEVRPDGWRQTGWFADRDAFGEFAAFWQRNGSFRLCRLTRDGDAKPPGDGLTGRQREALRIAYELGYFDVPRGASLADVGTELGISASAASERLRRAQTRLVEETVATAWPPLPD
jgi:hypothetical protein